MNQAQLLQGLIKRLAKSRIVFWQDTDAEFTDQLTGLVLDDVEIINLDEQATLAVKQRIELLEPEQTFLLYSTHEVPIPQHDWLYDIRQYAEQFYADSSSLILNDLGIKQMAMRSTVGKYKPFFGSKQRMAAVQKIIPENPNRQTLEITLMAALLKLDTATFLPVLHRLLSDLNTNMDSNDALAELERYGLTDALWEQVQNQFGYHSETPALPELCYKLFATDCLHGIQGKADIGLKDHLLPMPDPSSEDKAAVERVHLNSAKRANVVTFMGDWRQNRSLSANYNLIAEVIEQRLEIKTKLAAIETIEPLLAVETFKSAEQRLLSLLIAQLPALPEAMVEETVSRRLNAHWCHADSVYTSIYKAIHAAHQFLSLRQRYRDGFSFESALTLYQAYTQHLYKFDYYYRLFAENARIAAHEGLDILKQSGLPDAIEQYYVDGYLHDLAIEWGRLVDEDKLLSHWTLPTIKPQYDFYANEVGSVLKNTQMKRVFVIISDALRYEVAQEIHDAINEEKRFNASISSQLGVVPSYTQLGMASLLPHDELNIKLTGKKAEIKVDGQSTHGFDNRAKILNAHGGLAVKSAEVLRWTNQQGRDKVKDASVVYIYHDEIDAIGDKRATEDSTFSAARTTVNEIHQLVNRVINRLKGTRVIITADHGFLFKESDVTDSDKTALKVKPPGTVEASKRYIIGSDLPKADFYWHGQTKVTANSSCDTEFIVPRGSNRFNFVGGARFIHGGIMPQEVCVPVLHVRELKTKLQQSKHIKEPVGVVPLNSPIRIVANIDKLDFLQTDPVGSKHKARMLEVYIEDPEGTKVSSVEKVTFDSTSGEMSNRKRTLQIALIGTGFDRSRAYRLILWRPEEKDVYASHSVTIDLAFEDDFF